MFETKIEITFLGRNQRKFMLENDFIHEEMKTIMLGNRRGAELGDLSFLFSSVVNNSLIIKSFCS